MSDPASSRQSAPDKPLEVRKRDGAVEPFHPAKLRSSIRSALCAIGDSGGLDLLVARGLTEAIEQFLLRAELNAPIPTTRLLELVELVLTQTGHAAAAAAVRRHATARERQRRWLIVAAAAANGLYVHRRWNKGQLVRYLSRQHLLDAPASRMIAGRVEQLVFNCGLKVVTAGLVREMVDSELLAWGLLPAALAVKRSRPAAETNRDKVRDNLESTQPPRTAPPS